LALAYEATAYTVINTQIANQGSSCSISFRVTPVTYTEAALTIAPGATSTQMNSGNACSPSSSSAAVTPIAYNYLQTFVFQNDRLATMTSSAQGDVGTFCGNYGNQGPVSLTLVKQ
jgi:hypothetical protein